jgi:hypothetical protein
LIRGGTTRETAMDFWRCLLAVAQVAAAVQINFGKVEGAPTARFHRIGDVFPDALYGHIIITFDVAVLRGQMKDLQEGISYRRERAMPKHRDVYDVLEENLVAGNQELESNMTFFATAERKDLWRVDRRRTGALERSRNTPGQEDGQRHEEGAHDRGTSRQCAEGVRPAR